jgi:hypothetical protein
LQDPAINAALTAAREAITSSNSEQLDAAESELRKALQTLRCGGPVASGCECDSLLESCRKLDVLLRSAAQFYSGLAGLMKVQLQGYGSFGVASQARPGNRFAVEA